MLVSLDGLLQSLQPVKIALARGGIEVDDTLLLVEHRALAIGGHRWYVSVRESRKARCHRKARRDGRGGGC